jgi:hypothetical protein
MKINNDISPNAQAGFYGNDTPGSSLTFVLHVFDLVAKSPSSPSSKKLDDIFRIKTTVLI